MLKVIEHIDLYIWQAVERQPDWSQLKSYTIASILNAFEWDFLWHGTDIVLACSHMNDFIKIYFRLEKW